MAHDPSSKSAVVDLLPRRSVAQVIEQLTVAREQLPAGTKAVLAFDADGTLWRGDVSNDLFDTLLAENAIRPTAAAGLEALARELGIAQGEAPARIARALYDSWEQRLTPSCPEETTLKMQAWIYAGYSEEELLAYSRRVLTAAGIAERIRGEVRQIIGWARASDVDVVVVSASPRWPVVAAVTHLDIAPSNVFALDLKSEGGVYRPELNGVFVYADGKATAVKEGRPGATVLGAFGDSAYDAALLRLSAVPVAIAPGPGLLRVAASVPDLIELELAAT